jgi:hypothetical protein
MGAINPDWYAANATRAYPLDDAATARDDAGRELPPQILVDCRVRFPLTLGRFAYIGGVTVGPSIVTATLLAAPDALRPPGGTSVVGASFQPLGAVSLPRPVQPNRHYPIQPMAAGVGGWLVFGRGINDEPYSGRFSTPAQSLLLPRVASAYHPLPIPSLGKLGLADALAGVVQLLGGTDIEVIQALRKIDGAEVNAIVIRLVDSLNRNVFNLYAGPCSVRPESNNCAKPALQAINTVLPDCDGNLTIDFQGAGLTVVNFADGGGLALDLALGLADTCTDQDYLPDDTGKLPSDYEDECPPVPSIEPPPGGGDIPPPIYSADCVPLPYYESFDAGTPATWTVVYGDFTIEADESPGEPFGLEAPASGPAPGHIPGLTGLPPLHRASGTPDIGSAPINKSYAAINQSKRNVSVWNCGYDSRADLTCVTHLKVLAGPQANGGLIWNYFLNNPQYKNQNTTTYLMVLINPITNSLELWNYVSTGISTQFQRVGWWAAGSGVNQIVTGDWYQLKLRTRKWVPPPVYQNMWSLDMTVTGVSKPGFAPIHINQQWGVLDDDIIGHEAIGQFGVGSINAHCLFSFFQLGETPS